MPRKVEDLAEERINHRVDSQVVAVNTGPAADTHRNALGFAVDDSEDGAFWAASLPSPGGVALAMSNARAGLRGAVHVRLSNDRRKDC